jgi:hypothetical protein
MKVERLKILLDITKNKYDTIANADDAIDGKVGVVMGFEIAIIIGYLTFKPEILSIIQYSIGFTGILALLTSLGFLVYVNWPKTYNLISEDIFEGTQYLNFDEERLLAQLIKDGEGAIIKNKAILHKKAFLYKVAAFLLMAGFFLLATSLIYSNNATGRPKSINRNCSTRTEQTCRTYHTTQ